MRIQKIETLQTILGLWGVFLCASPWSLATSSPDPAIVQQRLNQVQDQREKLEKGYARSLKDLNDKISSQTVDPDTASDERFRIQSEYRRDLNNLNSLEQDLLQSRASATPPSQPSRPAPPKNQRIGIPSQQVIEFTPAGNTISTPEPPRQKNVGVGVREVEF